MRGGRKEGKILEAPWAGPGGAPPPSALWLPCILKDFLVPSLLFAEMGEPLCDPSLAPHLSHSRPQGVSDSRT